MSRGVLEGPGSLEIGDVYGRRAAVEGEKGVGKRVVGGWGGRVVLFELVLLWELGGKYTSGYLDES
jgi:hypothetical protein